MAPLTPPQFLSASETNLYLSDTIFGLTPGRTYHYRVAATNTWGSSTGADVSFQWQPSSPVIGAAGIGPDNALRFTFTGLPGHGYLVLTSTNLTHWESVGMADEKAAGQFEYLATPTPQSPARFYRLLSP